MSDRRLRHRDRLGAWLVTGPIGRAVAFFADLGAYAWDRARDRTRRPG